MSQKPEVTVTESVQEISLLDVLHFLTKHKKTLLTTTISAGIVAALMAMWMPNTYTAKLRILPPQGNLIQTVVTSGNFADDFVRHRDLTHAYQTDSIDAASLRLLQHVNVKDKESVFTIEVDDTDPGRAQKIANYFPEELDKFAASMGLSKEAVELKKAELRIQSLQKELEGVNKELAATEKNRPANLQAAQKTVLTNLASLKAELDFVLETDANVTKLAPNLDRTREQLTALLRIPPNSHVNLADEHYLELFNNARYLEARITRLQKQHSLLSIDMQINNTRVLESAALPTKASKPKRLLIVVSSVLATALLTILLLLLKEWIASFRKQESQVASML